VWLGGVCRCTKTIALVHLCDIQAGVFANLETG